MKKKNIKKIKNIISLTVLLLGICVFAGILFYKYNLIDSLFEDKARASVLEEANMDEAFGNVKSTFVQIHLFQGYTDDFSVDMITDDTMTTKASHGSGNVWDITDDSIIIVTNYHVIDTLLEDYSICLVCFQNGIIRYANILYGDEEKDVAFISVDIDDNILSYEGEIKSVVYNDLSDEEVISAGDRCFTADSDAITRQEIADFEMTGNIANKLLDGFVIYNVAYAKNADIYVMLSSIEAHHGMSGSGIFDEKGYYVGMLKGVTETGNAVSVLLSDIKNAWSKCNEQ